MEPISGILRRKNATILIFLTVSLLLVCSQVGAHKVTVFAWVEGDTVHVESKFSGGRKTVAAPVEVYDSQGNLLLKGVTDDQGAFAFKAPQKTEMKIVLLAGMGHRGEWTIQRSDFENTDVATPSQPPKTDSPSSPMTDKDQENRSAPSQSAPALTTESVSADEIRSMVEEAIDKKLKPVMKSLADMRQSGPSLTDILGGIGYIIGLVGVAAYVSSKRRNS
jgi:nickel transport protein